MRAMMRPAKRVKTVEAPQGSASALAQDKRGAAAVEFAIVAPVFLALLFSIFEAAYYFFVSAAVDQATQRAARLVRTGQVQSTASPISRDAFFQQICDVVQHFGNCDQKLTVDVQRFDNFSALAADLGQPTCRDADPAVVGAIPYSAGAARDIVRVRVCYLHKSINPALGLNLATAPDGSRKMFSVAIFRNEPFED
jgi:Flp pilus assembly pilin Flp